MNTQIYEEACNWFVDLRAGDVDAAARQRFDAWIRRSPEHLRAYLEITEVWQDASQLEFGGIGQDVDALVGRANEQRGNVIPFEVVAAAGTRPGDAGEGSGTVAPRSTAGQTMGPRNTARRVAIAASLILCAGATAYAWYQFHGAPTYYTSVGEQRVISLEDGSSVKLNTRSRIRVHFTEQGRDIDLVQGQALFQVAKDASRPFTVRIDDLEVRAVGTQFDIYRKESAATITVIEGQVVIGSDLRASLSSGSAAGMPAASDRDQPSGSSAFVSVAPRAGSGTHLSAGQQVTVAFNADEPVQPHAANVDTATAWTQQKLVFRAASLPEVAKEFNRYNKRQLVIADAELASFRISGVYSSTDPSLLLTFLREQPGMRVEETEGSIVVTQRE